MIHAITLQELRIGNIVSIRGDPMQTPFFVKEIGETMKITELDGSEPNFVNIHDLSGVPMTEKWWRKAGFTADQVFRFRVLENEYRMKAVRYVHEFQNSWYFVRGKELTFDK